MRSSAYSAILVLTLVLGGCGSIGGGGTPAVTETETPVPPPCIPVHGGDCVTPEEFARSAAELVDVYRGDDNFRNQWGLSHIKADRAYSNLRLLEGADAAPGAGVTIGFVDSGIDQDHVAFAERNVNEEFLELASDETGDSSSHGTAVASVAAGGRSSFPGAAHGVAWGADIAMFAIPVGSARPDYMPISIGTLARVDGYMAGLVDHALAWRDGDRRVDILNVSVGYPGIIDSYSEQVLRENFGSAIAAMAQAGADEKTILVWAAGNGHGRSCDQVTTDHCTYEAIDAVSADVMSGLPARIEELQGHSIAVVALSPADGQIASFSNRCGIAAGSCIAAPGQRVRGAYFGPGFNAAIRSVTDRSGTSFAAPMVSGGLALMKQLFRDQLSNTELVARLFATADKSGPYADASVYGQGSMDLGAATSPVGVLEVPSGGNVGQSGFRLQAMGFRPGAALGDGLRQSLATRRIMAVDSLGAPFWYRLGSFAGAAGGLPVSARLRGFLAPGAEWPDVVPDAAAVEAGAEADPGAASLSLHAARVEAQAEIRSSHLALAEGAVKATLAGQGGLSAAAFTTRGIQGRRPAVGATLAWRRAVSPVGLRAGWIGEGESLLGSIGEGAFGTLAGDTSFVGVDALSDLGAWRVGADAELGFVAPAARGGLVTGVSRLATSAFALHATRALPGSGTLRLSVSQPLRVESGRASLTVPAGRTRQGAVLYSAVRADLAPSGRQVDVAGQWRRPLAEGELRLGTVLSLRTGHRKAADPELTVLAGWRLDF